MKKRASNPGFTLAEILITLVILGFIGALAVPMVGHKRVKNPVDRNMVHGTVECYYSPVARTWENNNYQLVKYEDGEKSNGEDGACYFTAPSTGVYIIQAIGAGGDGAKTLLDNMEAGGMFPDIISATAKESGYIEVGPGFRSSIESDEVPDWVREEWNKQYQGTGTSKWIQYTIRSAVGAGGLAAYNKQIIANSDAGYSEECAELCMSSATCPDYCYNYAYADGGDSGRGALFNIAVKLLYSPEGTKDTVTYSVGSCSYSSSILLDQCNVSLVFNSGKSILLHPSQNGGNGTASVGGISRNGSQGQDFIVPSSLGTINEYVEVSGPTSELLVKQAYNTEAQQGQTWEEKRDGAATPTPKWGSISAQEPVRWEGTVPAITARFGEAGKASSMQFRVYENLAKDSEFKLVPAKNADSDTVLYIKEASADDSGASEWKEIMRVKSGEHGKTFNETLIVNSEDIPFPKEYYPNSFGHDIPDISISASAESNGLAEELGYVQNLSSSGVSSGATLSITTPGGRNFINAVPIYNYQPGSGGFGSFPLLSDIDTVYEHLINGVMTYKDEGSLDEGDGMNEAHTFVNNCPILGLGLLNKYYCMATRGQPGAIVISW